MMIVVKIAKEQIALLHRLKSQAPESRLALVNLEALRLLPIEISSNDFRLFRTKQHG